jgi:uncharacterized protein (DUF2147 family)
MAIRSVILATGLAALLAGPAAFAADGGIKGFWRTGDGLSVIEITDCTTGICGRIAAMPPDATATATDLNNPDDSKHSRALCKLAILYDLTQTSGTVWERGKIYDARSGNTYAADMKLTGPDTLDLRGYVDTPVLGRTDTWTRQQPGSFKPCS